MPDDQCSIGMRIRYSIIDDLRDILILNTGDYPPGSHVYEQVRQYTFMVVSAMQSVLSSSVTHASFSFILYD